jgi:hypothetical protein
MSAETEAKSSTYSDYHKKYYQEHKAQILQRCKETGAYQRKYKTAYERNKEVIREKALARYYAKKKQTETPADSAADSA